MLRPAFTRQLAGRLLHGESINLQGDHGLGRRQTLEDLQKLLSGDMRIIKANLRHYPDSLPAMVADLATQAGLNGIDSFGELLAALHEPTLITLHNFDEIRFGGAGGFDARFIEQLNEIGKRADLALLCITVTLPDEWNLKIDTLPLPPLP